MEIIKNAREMQSISLKLKAEGKTIAIVPTMGFLHEGHLSLIDKARELADIVIASLFVNPKQFAPNEDFESYPRDFEHDKNMLEARNVDYCFHLTFQVCIQLDFQHLYIFLKLRKYLKEQVAQRILMEYH